MTRYVIVEQILLSRLNTSFCNAPTTHIIEIPSLITSFKMELVPNSYFIKILPFGAGEFNLTSNKTILSSVINFIVQSKRFDGPLL